MRIIESIEEMREYSQQCKRDGKTIASVDTAGWLHKGHMSLVKIAKDNADIVILSISHTIEYLNHFETHESFLQYYKQTELISDIELCQSHGVDILCHFPDNSWDYEISLDISIPAFRQLTLLQPSTTPSVYLEVLKMWPQILKVEEPDITILGQKDIYQNTVVKSIINNLALPIKVIMAPISRELDGGAYSSRNRFLTPSERQDATSIYQTLHEVSRWSIYPSISKIKEHITNRLTNANGKVKSINICCAETLKDLDLLDREAIITVTAVWGEVKLIDNIIIEPQGIE